jgi:hypothetical protein
MRGGVLVALVDDPLVHFGCANSVDEDIFAGRFSCSWIFCSKASTKAEVVDVPVVAAPCSTGAGISTCRTSSRADSTSDFTWAACAGDSEEDPFREAGEKLCSRDSMSIFSSFSSSNCFNSRTSASRPRTRSSSDSVYPLGKALRLSLSLVLHSNPTLAHWEQQGLTPSHRIFLLRQRSHACAILLEVALPTLIIFMGNMPGMVADVIV